MVEPFRRVTSPARAAIDVGVPSLIPQLAQALHLRLEQELRPCDMTVEQAVVLLRSAMRPTTPNQLAEATGIDTGSMTRLLDRLEEKGLVARRRHPDDRRSVLIEVTADGRALFPRVRPIFTKVSRQLMAGFAGTEEEQFRKFLRHSLANLARRPELETDT